MPKKRETIPETTQEPVEPVAEQTEEKEEVQPIVEEPTAEVGDIAEEPLEEPVEETVEETVPEPLPPDTYLVTCEVLGKEFRVEGPQVPGTVKLLVNLLPVDGLIVVKRLS